MGFSLEQIAKLLDENLPAAEIRGMLRIKQAELQRLVEEEQARLLRVEAKLKQIEQEDTMANYEIVLKKESSIKVASIREILPDFSSIGRLYDELLEYFKQHGVEEGSYCAAIWHDPEYKEFNVDGEAVISIEGELPSTERLKVYELPGVEKMACVVHHGSYNTIEKAYAALPAWIEANGYKIIGSNREVYIIGGNEQDNESYVTEVQFPITKA